MNLKQLVQELEPEMTEAQVDEVVELYSQLLPARVVNDVPHRVVTKIRKAKKGLSETSMATLFL